MRLSLRDIDYGIRLLALLTRNVPAHTFTHPYLLTLLIGVKFKNPDLYTELVEGNFQANTLIDSIVEGLKRAFVDENITRHLDRIEGFLYCADTRNREGHLRGSEADQQLTKLLGDDFSSESELDFVSQRARNATPQQLQRIIQAILDGRSLRITDRTFGQLATLIDTHQAELRR